MRVEHGITRTVLLAGRYAFKFPTMRYGWKKLLFGLLGNMQEREFGRIMDSRLASVLWAAPGGWLLVMQRVEPMHEEDFEALRDVLASTYKGLPVEIKADSFGWTDEGDGWNFVAIDFGGFGRGCDA